MNDIYHIDKARMRASFDRAAAGYDAAAVLQKEVRTRMLARLDLVKLAPALILDAGCGTGHASAALVDRFAGSRVVSLDIAMGMLRRMRAAQSGLKSRVGRMFGRSSPQLLCADIERLPLATGSAGLVWSNLAVQWCNDLDLAFGEVGRVLQPEGLF